MPRIQVGINENVILKAAKFNDKKRLVLTFSPADSAKTAPTSVFDTLLTAGVQDTSSDDLDLTILGPLKPTKEDQTQEKKIELVTGDIRKILNQFTQILQQYIKDEEIDITSMDVQFQNTGITDAASFTARILDQETLNRIYDNICNRFVQLITPFLDNAEYKVRLKLIRQSKDKHFATLPSRYIADNPFIESMDVPLKNTRVKFTKYEEKEGLNDGTPTSRDTAEKKGSDTSNSPSTPVEEVNPFAAQA